MRAVGGGGPGADDGQRFLAAGPQVSGAADPQCVGPRGTGSSSCSGQPDSPGQISRMPPPAAPSLE
jgi:hypothetical protein